MKLTVQLALPVLCVLLGSGVVMGGTLRWWFHRWWLLHRHTHTAASLIFEDCGKYEMGTQPPPVAGSEFNHIWDSAARSESKRHAMKIDYFIAAFRCSFVFHECHLSLVSEQRMKRTLSVNPFLGFSAFAAARAHWRPTSGSSGHRSWTVRFRLSTTNCSEVP